MSQEKIISNLEDSLLPDKLAYVEVFYPVECGYDMPILR